MFIFGFIIVYVDVVGVVMMFYMLGGCFSFIDGVMICVCWDYDDFLVGMCLREVKMILIVVL